MPVMVHDELGPHARQDVADVPEVIAAQEARGWRVATEDEVAELDRAERETPSVQQVPAGPDEALAAGEWVDMVHPDLPGQTQRVPNNPAALAGQLDVGWTFPAAEPDAVKEELKELRDGKGGRATKAEREHAEQLAAARAAVTDEPPAAPTTGTTDQPAAGDDTKEN
jgi:hypothetical protein